MIIRAEFAKHLMEDHREEIHPDKKVRDFIHYVFHYISSSAIRGNNNLRMEFRKTEEAPLQATAKALIKKGFEAGVYEYGPDDMVMQRLIIEWSR